MPHNCLTEARWSAHLELLKRLLQQTETYELNAGTDLYHEPAKSIDLLREARGDEKLPRIVIELTNRCNLSCGHCFDERHAATGDLSLAVLEKVLREGKSCGIEQVSFTGGEPTIHRRFREIIERVAEAGYPFSFVSNGTTFPGSIRCCLNIVAGFLGLPSAWTVHKKRPMTGCAAKDRTGA